MRTKLIILGFVMSIAFAFLAYIPFGTDNISIPPSSKTIVLFLLLVDAVLLLCYYAAYRLIKKENNHQKVLKTIVLFTLVFGIILLLITPIGSADVYNYILRARVATVYEENPYLVPTENLSADQFFHFAPKEWNYLPMQYGPLWTSLSIGFSHLAQNSLFWNQFIYKLLALLTNLGTIYFIWRILTLINPAYRVKGVLLYAWNPLILFEAVNNGHNDIFMIFLVVAAIYLFLKKKFLLTFLFLLLSALIKYITFLLMPVFLIFLFREILSSKKKIEILASTAVVLAIVAVILYLPYWEGFQIFRGLIDQSKITTVLNLSLFPSFALGFLLIFKKTLSWSIEYLMQIVGITAIVAFAGVYLCQLKKIWKQQDNLIYRSFLILLMYVLYASVYVQPWYFLWFLSLAVIIDRKYFPSFIFISTIFGLLFYFFYIVSVFITLFFLILFFLSFLVKKHYFSPFLGFH